MSSTITCTFDRVIPQGTQDLWEKNKGGYQPESVNKQSRKK